MEFHQCSQRGKTGICFHLTLQGVDAQNNIDENRERYV
jgi:hypothetical protein